MDLGLLVLRMVVGLLFVGHGTQKLFGWFGGHGIEGTAGFLASLRYRSPRQMAVLNGLAEAGGGLLLAVGFMTPLGSAAIIGVMINAMATAHRGKGLWVTNGGSEYPLVLSTAAFSISLAGPGSYSLDAALGWETGGIANGFAALALGIIVGIFALAFREEPAAPAMQEPTEHRRTRAA